MPPIDALSALPPRLAGFARDLIAAIRTGESFAPEGAVPQSEAEAHAVQAAVAGALERRPAAYKASRRPGQPALWAPIAQARCHASGAEVVVPEGVGIELEIGWKLIAPLPGAPEALAALLGDRQALRAMVQPLPVLELIHSRITGPLATDPYVKLADDLGGHSLVIGTAADTVADPAMSAASLTFSAPQGALLIDGAPACEALAVPGGDALATLASFLETLASAAGPGAPLPFAPGQILITGSLHPAPRPHTRARLAGRIEGLGEVAAQLAPGVAAG